MNEFEERIVAEIQSDLVFIGREKHEPGIRRRWPEFVYNGCPYSPSRWLGRSLDSAETKAFSRACQSLADAGLVTRVCGPSGRTTHVRPSVSLLGHMLAEADDETGSLVLKGLRRTVWGPALAGQLVGAES